MPVSTLNLKMNRNFSDRYRIGKKKSVMVFKVERINETGALNCKIGAILGQAIGIPEL